MKKILSNILVCGYVLAALFCCVSCDSALDVQQSYPFTVETMPVPNKVAKGQTVEIRCELKKGGSYANTVYTIRYFQFEGAGSLKTASCSNPMTAICWKTRSSVCTIPLPAMKRRISSWWSRIISGSPLKWSLT